MSSLHSLPLRSPGTTGGSVAIERRPRSIYRCLMTAAKEENEREQDQTALPASAPWWAHLAVRHGISALIAIGALYVLAKQVEVFPAKMEQLADKVAEAIKNSGDAQVRAMEAAERRAEERTRNAVLQVISEVQKKH